MELLQLRYFYESAKNENFSKTAKMFMVPTTSVSASIKRLETELGCKLFDRTANRISLNENGLMLQNALCSVFQDIDAVVEDLSAHSQDTRTIKLLIRGMRREITDLITEYSTTYPNVTFKTVLNKDENYQSYDIIVDDEKTLYEDYDRIELFNVRLGLKCSASSDLCRQKLSLNQLCKQPFVIMDLDGNMHRILKNACNRAGFSPNISAICNDIECYEKIIASGMGIGIARQTENFADSPICNLDVKDFNEHYSVYAYYSKKEYYGRVKDFVNFLKNKSI